MCYKTSFHNKNIMSEREKKAITEKPWQNMLNGKNIV